MTYDVTERSDTGNSKIELFLFETENGVLRYGYTNAGYDITVMGLTFVPRIISRSAFKASGSENAAERLVVKLPFDDPVVLAHVPYLPPRPMKLSVFAYHRHDAALEVVRGFTGSISNFAQRGEIVELSVTQVVDSTQQSVPWAVHKRGCIWATYEYGCDLNRENFKTVGSVQSSAATTIQAAALASKPNGWFKAGYVENPATGDVRFITDHVGDTVKVIYPFINLANGTVLNFYAGDDHTPETCHSKFNNKLNYLGFDRFPTFNPFIEGTYGSSGGGGGSRGPGGVPIGGGGGNWNTMVQMAMAQIPTGAGESRPSMPNNNDL